jgi:hypothetical protein
MCNNLNAASDRRRVSDIIHVVGGRASRVMAFPRPAVICDCWLALLSPFTSLSRLPQIPFALPSHPSHVSLKSRSPIPHIYFTSPSHPFHVSFKSTLTSPSHPLHVSLTSPSRLPHITLHHPYCPFSRPTPLNFSPVSFF